VKEEATRQFLRAIGEDPDREGLQETPRRVSEAWAYWTSGYAIDPVAILKSFEDGADGYSEMVFQGSIPFWSTCEHHLAPFFGVAHVAYIPEGRIVGLSKLSRLVDAFARRLQVQERLCAQVADTLFDVLKPLGVGVVMQCRHSCMESRGVQKAGTITTTSALRVNFLKEPSVRAEFMAFVNVAGMIRP
jgi:GTP cyclohydrolase I